MGQLSSLLLARDGWFVNLYWHDGLVIVIGVHSLMLFRLVDEARGVVA